MKKFFTLISIALFALTVNAQSLKVAGMQKAKAFSSAKIDAADNQIWWGYGDVMSVEQYGLLGTTQAEEYNVAMYITGDNPLVVDHQIKAVRIALNDKSVITGVKVWLSTTQPSSYNAANVWYKELDDAELVDLANDGKTIDVALDEPYTVTSQGLYVGYTFTVTSVAAQAGKYPIVMIQETNVPNSHFIKTAYVGGQWMDATSYGMCASQVLVEGEFATNSISVSDFGTLDIVRDNTDNAHIEMTNLGANAINSVAYTTVIGGTESEEKNLTVAIPMGGKATIDIPITANMDLGTYDATIKFTKVNGEAVEGVESNGSLNIVGELKDWPRKVLIEEFTTEQCTFCPDAAAGLEAFHSSYPEIAEQTATICHHAGFYTDWLTISASNTYCWFYGTNGTYAPAFMWDRYCFPGNSDNVPVEGRPSGGSGHRNKVNQRLAVKSYANIDLEIALNEDNSKAMITANCERGKVFGSNVRLFLFITEDNVPARKQSGASGSFIHQHVARACNATWGEALEWVNNEATYSYTFDLNSTWALEDLKVVAFLANYDPTNRNNCVVEQVADSYLQDPNSIEETDSHAVLTEVARYTVDGRQLARPEKGINIVRLSNGETVKVLVK